MVCLNKIQKSFTNVKSTNTETKLEISELPTGSGMVFEPPRPEVLGSTSGSWVIELPTRKHKWTLEKNRMLWKCYFESDTNAREYMERIHQLWIEKGGRQMTSKD